MKKIIPIAGLVLSMTAANVNAQMVITENEMNMNTGVLTIEGVTEKPDTMVSINIPKAGVTPEQLQASGSAGNNIVYSGQKSSGANGEFTFTVDFLGSDEEIYEVYIGSGADVATKKTKTSYLEFGTYETLITALNSEALSGETEFNSVFDSNEEKLFLYPDIVAQNKDIVRKILYNYAKDTGFLTTDSALNMRVYKAALAAQLISDGRVSDARTLFGDMYITDNGVIDSYGVIADFETYVNTDEKREYFASKFKDCASLSEFNKEFTNSMILTVVRYPENVTKLQGIFEKYHNHIGANTTGAELTDYSSISGNTYSDIATCVKVFNDAVGQPGDPGSQPGAPGGSSGGASGGASSSDKDTDLDLGTVQPGGINVDSEKIDIKFEDLNSVPWAYTSISELFERNIISGKSETRFAPNDKITREEFATLLVKIAGVEVNNSTNVFSDVEDNAWYEGYVNAAFEKGFCNGIGNGLFGVGMEITRQDMCVMAYNVLNFLGFEAPDAELLFDDASQFGNYAKAPVAALNKLGIVNGVGNNKFNPTGNATRAEAAVIIHNILMYIG